jgi:ABC-type transporter Mla subunit MlaD
VRKGLERAIQATETLVEGIDNAGVPDTPEGDEAANQISDWADSANDDLEEAQDSLDEEADSLEDSIEQLTAAAGTIATVLAGGVQTFTDVARLDTELAAALQSSPTCQDLREERG